MKMPLRRDLILPVTVLADSVLRYTDAHGGAGVYETPVSGLWLNRSDQERPFVHRLFKPTLCVVAQGSKTAVIGGQSLVYAAGQALVASVEVPGVGRVVDASADCPYLGVIIEFDVAIMREVWEGMTLPAHAVGDVDAAVFVADVDVPLGDCVLRLVRLLDTPAAIPTLRPLIMREISYWLLAGPNGGAIARMALAGTHSASVLRAVHILRDRFTEVVRVDELAKVARLSPSAFHRQFRAVTSLSPLQYQKQLRLLEARRLMVSESANAEGAAYQVGYESASQFSREYARMFGAPPRRDASLARSSAGGEDSG